jgi:aldose 1-epimerase
MEEIMSACAERREEPPAELLLEQPEALAALTPSEGFWCTQFRVRHGDEWVRILAEPPTWEALQTRPTFYGNPLLFPYPLSIADGTFTYRGKRYTVRSGKEGRTIHGLVRDHAWTDAHTWRDVDGAHARAAIVTGGEDADLLAFFPFPFRFTVTYTLAGTSLTSHYEATNIGDEPMPLGLGIHPYFPVPLVPGGQPSDAVVRSDVARMLRGGLQGGQNEWLEPQGVLDLRVGQRVDALMATVGSAPSGAGRGSLLLVYTQRPDLDADAGRTADTDDSGGLTWSLIDTVHDLTVDVESSDDFCALVVYAPPTQHVISPVVSTCLSDAFNRAARGQPSGMIELEPGETWRGWTRIVVS